jgi:hypothetical protein
MSTAADTTAQKQQIGRPFEPGQSGNPTGRPKGARNKLSEAFLQALAEDFETHGKDTIVKVRTDRPNEYLRIVAMALPKRMELEDATPQKPAREMTDDELNAVLWNLNENWKSPSRTWPMRRQDEKGGAGLMSSRAAPWSDPAGFLGRIKQGQPEGRPL